MSEKRHRQQQRRQRRKAARRSHSTGQAKRRGLDHELAELLAGIATIALQDAHEPSDALEAEQWASGLIGTLHVRAMLGEDVEELFLPGFIAEVERIGTPRALATLRALGAVGADRHGRRARAAADRLASRGLPEPPWSHALGLSRPTAAALMSDEVFDDGVSVLVQFSAAVEQHTLVIYIDHNMGGLVKDVFLAGPLAEVRRELDRQRDEEAGPAIRELDLAEARARVEDALYMLDHTYAPPVSEDVRLLRALIEARIRLLPDGAVLPDEHGAATPKERDELLADFLASNQGRRWRGDEHAEEIVALAIDFGADYNHGGPLRWSSVVVEIFMTSWLARKIAREPEFFERVPDVLPDWVAYAGRRRGVPAVPLREAVASVEDYREEMLDATSDPEAWGPAKAFAVAAQHAGVDLSDPDAVARFVDQYNSGLAA
jgi:hypothetical protein